MGTRKEELLLTEKEKNRGFFAHPALPRRHGSLKTAIAFLLKRMQRTKNNEEFFQKNGRRRVTKARDRVHGTP